jgi:transposase-like protein
VDDVLNGRGNSGPYKRPNFPMEFKRQLAEQSFEAGASAALVARQSDINPNLLFKWRRQYLQGAYGLPAVQANAAPVSQQGTQTLSLRVTVIDDVAKPHSVPSALTATPDGGVCESSSTRRARYVMMGQLKSGQDKLFYSFNLDNHVPQSHLLRGIDPFLDLQDLRQHLAPFYRPMGRPSTDPDLMGPHVEPRLLLDGSEAVLERVFFALERTTG